MPGIVGAQVDGCPGINPVAIVIVQGRYLDLAKVRATEGKLPVVQLRKSDTEFGGETGRPVREDLADVGLDLGTPLVKMLVEFELVAVRV